MSHEMAPLKTAGWMGFIDWDPNAGKQEFTWLRLHTVYDVLHKKYKSAAIDSSVIASVGWVAMNCTWYILLKRNLTSFRWQLLISCNYAKLQKLLQKLLDFQSRKSLQAPV